MKMRTWMAGGALLLSANLIAQTDVRQGLVAYWPLDEIVDGVTPELVSGQHMQAVNMDASSVVAGKRGSALNFDGATQYTVLFSDPTANTGLPITQHRAFTIAFWVNATDPLTVQDRRMFSESSSTDNDPLYNVGTDNTANLSSPLVDLFIRNNDAGNPVNHRKSALPALNGEWRHVAVVDNNGAVTLYVDGVADPAATFTYTGGVLTADTTSLGAIVRASASTPVSAYFTGALDDVTLWERPLSAAEVQNVFQNGIQTPIPTFGPFVTQQPVSATRALGTRVMFAPSAVGLRPSVTYQWLKNAQPIEGATGATLTINNILAGDAGAYSLRMTTPNGETVTDAAQLTVLADPAADVRNGLLSFWPLDTLDAAAPTTPDLYSRNDFQLMNMDAANFVPSPRTNALVFDGIDEYAFRSSGSPIYPNTNFTVSLWVKGAAFQADRRVFSEGSAVNNTPLFNIGTASDAASGALDIYIRNDDNAVVVNHRKSTTAVFDDTWHHVVWVDPNGAARLYLDGVLDATDFSYTRGTLTPTTTSIGAILRSAQSALFTGEIDDVAVWNRALTYTEVQSVYTNGVPAPLAAIPASIMTHPVGANLFQGDRIVLNADATGTAPLTLEWFKDGQQLTGETNRTLLLSNVQPGDSGAYTFRASNTAGSQTSNPATVNVTAVTGLRTALMAHWPFETLGATTPDVINGNDLTAVNLTAESHVTGKSGKAITFNGVDQYLVRNHTTTPSIGLPITQHRAFTIAFWVNALEPDTVQDRRMFSEASTTDNDPLYNIGTANTASLSSPVVDMFIRNDNGGNPVNHRKSTLAALDETWHHITVVDNNGTVSLYVDGVLEPTTDFNYTRGILTANTTSFGAIVRAAVGAQFAGTIDEAMLWGRALTEVEVMNVAANGLNSGGGGSLEIAGINGDAATVRISVATAADPSTLKVQSINTVDATDWADVSGVTWTQVNGQAVAQFAAPATMKFYRIVGAVAPASGASILYAEDFEGVAAGWTHGGTGDSWDLGKPVIGPGLAYSGKAAWGTGLDTPYAPDTLQWLRSPAIDLTGVMGGHISYYEFRDIENTGDVADVFIKDANDPDGAPLAQLATNNGTRATWSKRSFVIPAEALGKRIIVEFVLTTDSANAIPRPGWFIDDFAVIRN
jgi:hypothetical protein